MGNLKRQGILFRFEEEILSKRQWTIVFVFLDTDKHASPYDILTVVDEYPDAKILKYENVTTDDAEKIVYDAMFPRGPEGARHTKIFVNGRSFEIVNEITSRISKCMFSPFELSIIVDPRGAYSTAAAAVTKALAVSSHRDMGGFEGKTVVVLSGTGPVGQAAARLCALEKANVILTSRELQKATAVATKVNEELGVRRIVPVEAASASSISKTIEDADMLLSAGAAGIMLVPHKVLADVKRKSRIVVDVNAIPPLGVEGLKPDSDGEEFLPGTFGVGALAVGKLKNAIELALIRTAVDEPKGVFDYRTAYDLAKKMVLGKSRKAEQVKSEPEKYWLP